MLTPAVSACVGNFDPALYQETDAGAVGSDSGVGLTGPLAEGCGAAAPLLRLPAGTRSFEFDVDTRSATDEVREVAGCTGRLQPGNDLFLAIDAVPGEHWHFHVDVDPFPDRTTANPSIYVLSDCRETGCTTGDGLDLCAVGSDEHFTFIPSAAGRYTVAFDSAVDGEGYQGRVLAFRTMCGDGTRDHSENCDDGNLTPGDGCDGACRTELGDASPAEVEVNDDLYAANLVTVPMGATRAVRAELAAVCESDVFAVEVPEGAAIRARLEGEGGAACPADLFDSQLDLFELGTAGASRRLSGAVATGEDCPSIGADATLARDLPAGTYFLAMSVVRDRAGDTVRYQLSVTVEE